MARVASKQAAIPRRVVFRTRHHARMICRSLAGRRAAKSLSFQRGAKQLSLRAGCGQYHIGPRIGAQGGTNVIRRNVGGFSLLTPACDRNAPDMNEFPNHRVLRWIFRFRGAFAGCPCAWNFQTIVLSLVTLRAPTNCGSSRTRAKWACTSAHARHRRFDSPCDNPCRPRPYGRLSAKNQSASRG